MAHFAYIRGSLGSWATGTAITQAEFWQMDQNMYRAVNGDAGGTWAPSSVITIGGSGLTVSGAFTTSGNTTIGDNPADNLTINAATIFPNTDVVFSGTGTIQCSYSATFSDNVVIGSDAADACTVNATLAVNNNATLGTSSADALEVNSTSTFNSEVTFTGVASFTPTVSSFNSALVAQNDSTIGSSLSDTCTIKAALSVENGATIGTDSGDVLTVNSTTTFNNGVTIGSTYADALTVNATTTFASPVKADTGMARDGYELLSMVADVSRNETTANTIVVTNLNGSNRILTLTATGPSSEIVKYVSNGSAANQLTVLDGATGRTLGVLAPATGIRCIMAAGSWWCAG